MLTVIQTYFYFDLNSLVTTCDILFLNYKLTRLDLYRVSQEERT